MMNKVVVNKLAKHTYIEYCLLYFLCVKYLEPFLPFTFGHTIDYPILFS